MARERRWWWASFAEGPPPDGFLGVICVEAENLTDLIESAWERGLNPGGEVLAFPLTKAPPRRFRNRRLTKKLSLRLQDRVGLAGEGQRACPRCNDPDPQARYKHRREHLEGLS